MSLFEEAVVGLNRLLAEDLLSEIEKQYIQEAVARLKTLETRYIRILELNNEYLESDERAVQIRKEFSEDRIFELLSANAATDPVLKTWLEKNSGLKIAGVSEISAFNLSEDTDAKIVELHSDVESFYHDLWAVKERVDKVNGFKNFNPQGVRDVRNQLILHIDKPNSGATIYSFGIATNGPVMRPSKPVSAKAQHDDGLVSNVENFLSVLIQRTQTLLNNIDK